MKKYAFLKEKLSMAALKMQPQWARDEKLVKLLENNAPLDDVEKIIRAGADVDAGKGQPLATAIRKNSLVYLHTLIDHGADVRIAHEMPLRLAVKLGHMPLAFELVRFGADTHAAQIHAALKGDKREAMFLDQWVHQFGDSIKRLEAVCREARAEKCNCPKPGGR